MNLAQKSRPLDSSKAKRIVKKIPLNSIPRHSGPGQWDPVNDDEQHLNSKYSKYEEEVLIDPFLRPPICLIIIAAAIFIASIVTIILYDKVNLKY